MLLPLQGHVLVDIKLFLSLNVFKYTPLGVSVAKNKILPKPEVSYKKVKIRFSALDIAFKFGQWVQITQLTDFAPKKILNQTGSAQINLKNTYIS